MQSGNQTGVKLPRVSIVIPAYNEEMYLPVSLASLKKQDYTGEYEVIVADNNSTDRTAEVARQWGARVVLEKRSGPACARQCGADAATGDIIAFLDADTAAPPHWISRIVTHFATHQSTVVVSGPYVFSETVNIKRAGSYALSFVNITLDQFFRKLFRKGGALWGCNFAVRRTAFEKAGGFDTGIPFYGEDYELALRLRATGRGDVLPFLFVYTSARRLRKLGVVTQYWNWIINYFSVLFKNHPISRGLIDYPARKWRELSGRYTLQRLATVIGFTVVLLIIYFFGINTFPLWLSVIIYVVYCSVLIAFLIYHGVTPRSRMFGNVWSSGSRDQKKLALTFDDGPQPYFTEHVLNCLEENGVKAAFFLTGHHAGKNPEVCRRIVAQGHIIGNHSEHHARWFCLQSRKLIEREINNTEMIIKSITGIRTRYFRPPYGFRTPWLMRTLQRKGYHVVTWDNMTDDWDKSKPADQIVEKLVKGARPGGILVLHDGRSSTQEYDRTQMLTALPEIISRLRDQGYDFVTIPDLIDPGDIY